MASVRQQGVASAFQPRSFDELHSKLTLLRLQWTEGCAAAVPHKGGLRLADGAVSVADKTIATVVLPALPRAQRVAPTPHAMYVDSATALGWADSDPEDAVGTADATAMQDILSSSYVTSMFAAACDEYEEDDEIQEKRAQYAHLFQPGASRAAGMCFVVTREIERNLWYSGVGILLTQTARQSQPRSLSCRSCLR